MSLEMKINDFKTKYSLSDDAIAEMLGMFNETFIELAHKLLNSPDIQTSKPVVATYSGPKKFATKIAAEYASENGLTLNDFQKEKITKKDIDELIKSSNKTKTKTATNVSTSKSKASLGETSGIPKLVTETCTEIKKTSKANSCVKCKGFNKTGDICGRPGTEKPGNAKNFYCYRHAMEWQKYEISSDSDLEEEPKIESEIKSKTENGNGNVSDNESDPDIFRDLAIISED